MGTKDPGFQKMLFPTVAEEWIKWGEETGKYRSEGTRRMYSMVARLLQERYPTKRVDQILTVDCIQAFLLHEPDGSRKVVGENGYSEGTIHTYRKAICSLVRWASRKGYCADIRDDISEAVALKSRTRRVANWLRYEDLVHIAGCAGTDAAGKRDKAIITIGGLTGLRLAELSALTWADIDLAAGTVHVRDGKGRKERWVGMVPQLEDFLRGWRAECSEYLGALPHRHPVIPAVYMGSLAWDRPGRQYYGTMLPATPFQPAAPATIYTRIVNMGKAAGYPTLAPHDLRRTFAGLLDAAGMPVQEISAQLGHQSIDTTRRYLESNPAKRANAMRGLMFA